MKIDVPSLLSTVVASAIGAAVIFYGLTQRELGVLSTKIDNLEATITEMKADKKELEKKVSELSEMIKVLEVRVGTVPPENASNTKVIDPTGSVTTVPLEKLVN